MTFTTNNPVGPNVPSQPQFLYGQRRIPTTLDIWPAGTQWQYIGVTPSVIYETTGAGVWNIGANAYATTLTPGIVQLSTSIIGDATSLTLVPTVKEIKDYVDAVAIAGAPDASTGTRRKSHRAQRQNGPL